MKMVVQHSICFLLLTSCILISKCSEDGLKLITQLPTSPLMKYQSYANVMILHFYIPLDSIEASFRFKAKDDSTSVFVTSCEPRNVSIYMKPGSYPVINPDGIPFPKTFLNISRPAIQELVLQTDSTSNYINLTSPTPGDWFALAFVSWSDPNKDRIQQEGLTSECEASLYAELSVNKVPNIRSLSLDTNTIVNIETNKKEFYKFYVPEDVDHVLLRVEILTPCKNCENILVYLQTCSVPNENTYQEKLQLPGKETIKNYLWFWPEEDNWHYLTINFSEITKNNKTLKDNAQVAIYLKYISGLQEDLYVNATETKKVLFKTSVNKQMLVKKNALQYNIPYKQYNLLRLSSIDNFVFEYDFRPNKNGSAPLLLNLTNSEMTVLKFTVREVIDIGGTLSLGLAIKPEIKNGVRVKLNNFTIVACLHVGAKEIPVYPDQCMYNNVATKAALVLNSTSAGKLDIVHIPYPDPGTYFMSIRTFYNQNSSSCVPCNCSDECEVLYEECVMDCENICSTSDCVSCMEDCQDKIVGLENCEGCNCDGSCLKPENGTKASNCSVIFSISSFPCIAGKCGDRGKCAHYVTGGFIFSSCHCSGGYRGWDCSDASQALEDAEILSAILLLTLSNLLFIPSIVIAYRRGYYTEAVTYFCSMIASTFYHACDSKENQYGYCIFPLSVLQFSDFYCGLLNIWVTLVAMSYTNSTVISIAHLAGAIILAFSVTYNKHALWVFILPAICGLLLIGINWGLQCRRTKKLFPAGRYLKLYMPIGGGLVLMGLISYAFLETKENYKFIHSLWHVVIALSLIFLLPNKKTFVPKYEID